MSTETTIDKMTILRDLERATAFFHGIATLPVVRIALSERGYSAAIHAQGTELFGRLLGFGSVQLPTPPSRAELAQVKLDAWDAPNYAIASAALKTNFPSQHAYLFADLTAETGFRATAGVLKFTRRIVALRDGTDPRRADSREADRAAAALLGVRKVFDVETETRVTSWLEDALRPADEPVVAEALPASYFDDALQFHNWLGEWRETARACVTRRAHLIRLGLVQRRQAKNAVEEPDENED